MLTFVDWFAGVGGFRRGMELAGHKCIGFCEYDKFAVKSYRAMHDTEGEWFRNDVRAVKYNDIPKSDVWCFGFPCQDISVAGKQKGMREGTRSGLFYTITSLLRQIETENRPGTLFIENVKNLFSVNGGWDFAKVIIELDEVGYDCEWQLLNSKNFGVPQNRERVFIIGHSRTRGRREVFPIGGSYTEADIKQIGNCMPTATRDNPNQGRIYDTNGLSPCLNKMDGGGREPLVQIIGNVNPSGNGMNGRVYSSDGLSPTLTTNKGEGSKIAIPSFIPGPEDINRTLRTGGKGSFDVKHSYDIIAIPVLTPDRPEKRQNGRRFKEDGEEMFTLTAQDRHGVAICDTKNCYGNPKYFNDISPTLLGSHCKEPLKVIRNGVRIRKLIPLECFRLQGWSDDYFYKAASVNSDSQLYKQAGNGVSVPVIFEIAKRLEVGGD